MAYKIKVDAVAVPRALFEYEGDDGEVKYHCVSTVRVKDEVVQDDEISPHIRELYEDGDESVTSVYEKVDDDHVVDKPPLDNYDELSDFDVRVRMQTMSSEQIESVKAYEREHKNREGIVDYVTGYGESPTDRNRNEVVGQSGHQTPEPGNKAVDVITPKRRRKATKAVNKETSTPQVEEKPKAQVKPKRDSVKKQHIEE